MKILHVFDRLSPHTNGTSHVLYQLAKALAERGHEVTIYTTDYKSEREYLDLLAPVKTYPFHNSFIFGGFYYTPGIVREAKKNLGGLMSFTSIACAAIRI
ncbi:MAG: glycosyltransferase [Chloroflexota bacterium]|nr:glycosyltransferase [Chloroflexota bacterium]